MVQIYCVFTYTNPFAWKNRFRLWLELCFCVCLLLCFLFPQCDPGTPFCWGSTCCFNMIHWNTKICVGCMRYRSIATSQYAFFLSANFRAMVGMAYTVLCHGWNDSQIFIYIYTYKNTHIYIIPPSYVWYDSEYKLYTYCVFIYIYTRACVIWYMIRLKSNAYIYIYIYVFSHPHAVF